jgi:hypothetical protein
MTDSKIKPFAPSHHPNHNRLGPTEKRDGLRTLCANQNGLKGLSPKANEYFSKSWSIPPFSRTSERNDFNAANSYERGWFFRKDEIPRSYSASPAFSTLKTTG